MTRSDILATLAVAVIGLPLLGLGVKTMRVLPDDTIVSLDAKSGTYATFECIRQANVSASFSAGNIFDALDNANRRRLGDVRNSYDADRACSNADGFIAEKSNLTRDIIRDAMLYLLARL